MPDEVREFRALVELFFEMPYADGRVVRRTADELFAYMSRCHEEMGLDVAHICGYHIGGFDAEYPLYEPLPEIGGADGLRAFAARCNAHEGWTTDIYINCRITAQTDCGPAGARDCRRARDIPTGNCHNGRYFSVAAPVSRSADATGWKIEEITRMGEGPGRPARTTARSAGPTIAITAPIRPLGSGFIDLFRRIRKHSPSRATIRSGCRQRRLPVLRLVVLLRALPRPAGCGWRTDPATRDWEHDWRGGMPELFRYAARGAVVAGHMDPADHPEDLERLNIMFLYSPMLYWPSLSVEYDLTRCRPSSVSTSGGCGMPANCSGIR